MLFEPRCGPHELPGRERFVPCPGAGSYLRWPHLTAASSLAGPAMPVRTKLALSPCLPLAPPPILPLTLPPPPPAPLPCSSNVVEKCLKLGGAGLNEQRDAVVVELMESPQLGRLLQVGAGWGRGGALALAPPPSACLPSLCAGPRRAPAAGRLAWRGSQEGEEGDGRERGPAAYAAIMRHLEVLSPHPQHSRSARPMPPYTRMGLLPPCNHSVLTPPAPR